MRFRENVCRISCQLSDNYRDIVIKTSLIYISCLYKHVMLPEGKNK